MKLATWSMAKMWDNKTNMKKKKKNYNFNHTFKKEKSVQSNKRKSRNP